IVEISPRLDGSTSSRSPDGQLDRARIAAGAGIVLLRTVGDHHDHVLLRAQINIISGLGDALHDGHTTIAIHRYVHEEVDVRRNVPRPHPELGERLDEIVAAARGSRGAVTEQIDLATAISRQGVVTTYRVLNQCHHGLGDVVIEYAVL